MYITSQDHEKRLEGDHINQGSILSIHVSSSKSNIITSDKMIYLTQAVMFLMFSVHFSRSTHQESVASSSIHIHTSASSSIHIHQEPVKISNPRKETRPRKVRQSTTRFVSLSITFIYLLIACTIYSMYAKLHILTLPNFNIIQVRKCCLPCFLIVS